MGWASEAELAWPGLAHIHCRGTVDLDLDLRCYNLQSATRDETDCRIELRCPVWDSAHPAAAPLLNCDKRLWRRQCWAVFRVSTAATLSRSNGQPARGDNVLPEPRPAVLCRAAATARGRRCCRCCINRDGESKMRDCSDQMHFRGVQQD